MPAPIKIKVANKKKSLPSELDEFVEALAELLADDYIKQHANKQEYHGHERNTNSVRHKNVRA